MTIKGSYRAVFFYLSGVLCFISFFFVFLTPITIEGIKLSFDEVYFGTGFLKPCIAGFIGFILLLICTGLFIALGIFESLQIKMSLALHHTIELTSIIILFLAIMLIFCVKPIFLDVNDAKEEIDAFRLGIGPIIAGCISLGSAGSAAIGLLLPA